ncbi:hypothetical protein IAU60_006385 [Kwoniella sp. DSM 27419]
MGSTSSRPATAPSSSSSDSDPQSAGSPARRPSGTLARLNSLRRLSALGRRDGSPRISFKRGRERLGSSSTSDVPTASQDRTKRMRGGSPSAAPPTPTLATSTGESSRSTLHSRVRSRSPLREASTDAACVEPTHRPNRPSDPLSSSHDTLPPAHHHQPLPMPELGPPLLHPLGTATSPSQHSVPPFAASIPLPATPATEPNDPLHSSDFLTPPTAGLSRGHSGSVPQSITPNQMTESRAQRLRRSSSYPQPPRPVASRSMSDRLTAFLGFSTPADDAESISSPLRDSTSPNTLRPSDMHAQAQPTTPSDLQGSIDDIDRRLTQARAELAETQRRLDEARRREEEATRRRPAGAVIVIQGLAQTASVSDNEEETRSEEGTPRRPTNRQRRSSEGSHASPGPQNREDNDAASLEAQASMIGGLLTVAAAATATSLLSPDEAPPELPAPAASSTSIVGAALENIRNRLRPPRPDRSSAVQSALSGYLRSALNSGQMSSAADTATSSEGPTLETDTEGAAPAPASAASRDFQRFLDGLRADLTVAVREYAGPLPETNTSEGQNGDGDGDSFVTASDGVGTPQTMEVEEVAQPGVETEAPREHIDERTHDSPSTVPTFHPQLGQNPLPASDGTQRTPEVTGGTNGVPRRLNFFRAHLFPATASSGSGELATEDDADAMVPCIFIGVRSVRHSPGMTPEDLAQHPSFPFADGEADSADPSSDDPLLDDIDGSVAPHAHRTHERSEADRPATPAPQSERTSERRSLRERVMERLLPATPAPARRTVSARPLNTYVVYVIGGNYPRNHPVLAIPSLMTGGPLTDEEMTLVGELMGQAKPPTVQKEDIEKSGLKLVKGESMGAERDNGSLLEACVERCLICLGDYEPDDQCRILNCRHGYHKDCVDQWLSTGRNSCPACRSEAVDTSKTSASPTAPAEVGSDQTTPEGTGVPSGSEYRDTVD